MTDTPESAGVSDLDLLVEQLPDAALWVDARAHVLTANALAAQLFETSVEALRGEALDSCWLDDDGAPLVRLLLGEARVGLPELLHARTRSGRPCSLEATLIRGVRPDAVLLILREAEERAQHRARTRMLSAATEQVSEGMAIIDRRGSDTQLVWANAAFYSLLGFEGGARAPRNMVSTRVGEVLDALHPRRLFEDGPVSGRGTLERVDGNRLAVRYTIGPVHEPGDPQSERWWACTLMDTTEQDRLDRMLQEQQAVNRDARDMAALGDMVAGIAHDFNNSITVIRNLALLSSSEEELARVRDDLDSIMQASDDAAELARSLTAFGRRGAQQDREEIFDFDETVAQIVQVVGRGLRLKLEIETDLQCGARIRSRPGMLQQILYNLMINARDAVEERGHLLIRTRRMKVEGEDRVELVVADDGVGMPEDVREKAFVPYFTTKGSSGTGLGLAKVHYLLHQNRGTIRIESTPGDGTTFVIGLPVEPATAMRSAPSGTALLVDDDPAIRRLVPKLLARRGVECPSADSSAAVDGMHFERPPDLVIVDLVLGREDGRDVARTLRERWTNARYVLTTGAELPSSSEPPAPFDYVLPKPFGPADVDTMLTFFELADCSAPP
ncbi:MAG: ATP-binding protein [Pseudomonadales bacterium]|nr:ATP-binding protein [Pseudomonadales bacterium]